MAMGIMVLLAGAVYAIASSTINATREAMEQQLLLRRQTAFMRVLREAFLNLPAEADVHLEVGRDRSGASEQRLVIERPRGIFGLPSLGGGSLVLVPRARSDGSRTFTLLRIPPNADERQHQDALEARGIPLLPHVRKPRWGFWKEGNWTEEWPKGSPRPALVKLRMEVDGIPQETEMVFFIPQARRPPGAGGNSPDPNVQPPAPSPSS
jgi:hypothetical protein